MSDSDLLAALAPVLRVLGDLGVRHFVGGSIASSAHGVARASVDADVVAELGPAHVAAFVAALGDEYYVPEERVRDAVTRRSWFNLIHLGNVLGVVRATGGVLDMAYLRRSALELGVGDLLERALEEAGRPRA